MDFQEWLLKLGLHKKLPAERVKQVEEYYKKLQSQNQNVSVAHIVVQGKLLTNADIKELHQHYLKLQKLSTQNTQRVDSSSNSSQQHKITLFEELLASPESKPIDIPQESKPIDIPQESKPIDIPQESKPIDIPQNQDLESTHILRNNQPTIKPKQDEDLEATQISMKFDQEEVKVVEDNNKSEINFDDTFSGHQQDVFKKNNEKKPPKKIGKYEVLRKLGQGNMGEVYLVHDKALNRQLALKLILASSRDQKAIERFRKEAQAIAKLGNDNIIRVYDIHPEENILKENESVYFTMDYIEGMTLEDYIYSQKQKKIHFSRAVDIFLQVAKALAAAHHHKLIHRDIKPANIMLDKKNKPYLMDFGLAQEVTIDTKVSETQAFAGTPSYMSPEQAMSKSTEIDEQSDIYSLGVTFYEMLTGHLPFRSKELVTLLTQIVRTQPTPPSEYTKLPKVLESICLKAMAKDKKDRYLTADEMVHDLEKYMASGKKSKKTVEVDVVYHQREKTTQEKIMAFAKHSGIFIAGMFLMFMLGNNQNEVEEAIKQKDKIEQLYTLAKEENDNLKKEIDTIKEKSWQTAMISLPERKIRVENITPKSIEQLSNHKISDLHVNNDIYYFVKNNKGKITLCYSSADYQEKNIGNTSIFSSIWHNSQPYFFATNGVYTFKNSFSSIYPKFKLDNKILGNFAHTPVLWNNQIIFGNSSSGTLDAIDLDKSESNNEFEDSLAWSYKSEGTTFRTFSSITRSDLFIALGTENYLNIFINENLKNLKNKQVDKVWRFEAKEKVLIKPIIENDMIYFIADNKLYIADIGSILKISPANATSCLEYQQYEISNVVKFLLKHQNTIYICAGKTIHIVELDSQTSRVVRYYRYPVSENIKIAPVIVDNTLHVYSEENNQGIVYTFANSMPLNKYFIPYHITEWQKHRNYIYYVANESNNSYIIRYQP